MVFGGRWGRLAQLLLVELQVVRVHRSVSILPVHLCLTERQVAARELGKRGRKEWAMDCRRTRASCGTDWPRTMVQLGEGDRPLYWQWIDGCHIDGDSSHWRTWRLLLRSRDFDEGTSECPRCLSWPFSVYLGTFQPVLFLLNTVTIYLKLSVSVSPLQSGCNAHLHLQQIARTEAEKKKSKLYHVKQIYRTIDQKELQVIHFPRCNGKDQRCPIRM